jgi:type II secretory pathway pseudopilin PulG
VCSTSDWKIRGYSSGFLLIEAALLFVVLGICFSAIFPLISSMSRAQKQQVTKHNLSRIQNALDVFFEKNGYLPCPKPNWKDQALQKCHGVEEQSGIVPFEALEVPQSVAKDGEDKPFLYVISETSQIKQDSFSLDILTNEITLITDQNTSVSGISYVLVPGNPKKDLVFPYSTHNMEFKTRDQMKQLYEASFTEEGFQ